MNCYHCGALCTGGLQEYVCIGSSVTPGTFLSPSDQVTRHYAWMPMCAGCAQAKMEKEKANAEMTDRMMQMGCLPLLLAIGIFLYWLST